jgi:hypothetical protein
MSQERESLEPHVDQIQRRGGDGHIAMKPEGQLKGGDARAGISDKVQIADMVVLAFSVRPVRGNVGKCDADVAEEVRPSSD